MHITGTEYYVLVLCTALLLLLSITMLLSMYSGVCIMSIDTPYICIRSSSYYGIISWTDPSLSPSFLIRLY